MSEWRAGFARPWIEWDGVEGREGVVLVDGEPVPHVEVRCDSAGDHNPGHDHCLTRGGSEAIGFSWLMPLENRLWAVCLIDEHTSAVTLDSDPHRVRCPLDLSLRMDPPTAWLCPNNWDDDCTFPGHRSWDLGDAEGWAEFDGYESLMAAVRRWSRLRVMVDAHVCGRPTGPRPSGVAPRLARARRSIGTVTRAEYDAGERPAWWTEE